MTSFEYSHDLIRIFTWPHLNIHNLIWIFIWPHEFISASFGLSFCKKDYANAENCILGHFITFFFQKKKVSKIPKKNEMRSNPIFKSDACGKPRHTSYFCPYRLIKLCDLTLNLNSLIFNDSTPCIEETRHGKFVLCQSPGSK